MRTVEFKNNKPIGNSKITDTIIDTIDLHGNGWFTCDLTGYVKPEYDKGNIKETATMQEQEMYDKEQSFTKMQSFIDNNMANGLEYYNNKNVEITMGLFGRPQIEVNPIVVEIDSMVMPILKQIKNGDYYSAVILQLEQPTIQEVVDLKNEIIAYATNYIATHYV